MEWNTKYPTSRFYVTAPNYQKYGSREGRRNSNAGVTLQNDGAFALKGDPALPQFRKWEGFLFMTDELA